MPVQVNFRDQNTIPMNQMLMRQIGVICDGSEYDGTVVVCAPNQYQYKIAFFKEGVLVDNFMPQNSRPVRILQSGESFTVTIP